MAKCDGIGTSALLPGLSGRIPLRIALIATAFSPACAGLNGFPSSSGGGSIGGSRMNTFVPSASAIERKWYVVDATDMTLGRLASEVAKVLRGKNKPTFTPFLDTGDYVIIINADKIKVTGKKMDQKIYFRHSDYVGSARYTTLREMMRTKPVRVVEHAVRGMLPQGPLGRQMYRKLYVYQGAEHNHQAQKPELLTF